MVCGAIGSKLGPSWLQVGASWLQDRRQIASCMQLGQHSKNMENSMNIICFFYIFGGSGPPSWRSWGYLGSKLEVLGPSWLQVGRSWDHLGPKLGGLGTMLAPSCRSWGYLGSNLEGLGSILLPTWGHLGFKLAIWRASRLQDRRKISSLYASWPT